MWGKRGDMLVHQADPFNAEPPPGALGAEPVTPSDTFYSRNHGPIPAVRSDAWWLELDGLVDRPLRLTLEQLQDRFAAHTLTATLQCAGNRRAGLIAVRDLDGDPWRDAATSTGTWTGARLADVLAAAGVRDGARHVAAAAPDVSQLADPPQTYGASIPLGKARSAEVLLAWALNGEPLPVVHGGPVRLLVPGYVGARSVKWLQRVTVAAEPSDNYFQATEYRLLPPEASPAPGAGLPLGPVALNSAILAPVDGARVPAGRVPVRGYAFAGGERAVARVDVSGDGGRSWQQAELGPDLGRWAWRLWAAGLELDAGRHELVARAWDDAASLQPERPEHLWNPKGYVNNSWPRQTVRVGP